jgi:hypothetical protein
MKFERKGVPRLARPVLVALSVAILVAVACSVAQAQSNAPSSDLRLGLLGIV